MEGDNTLAFFDLMIIRYTDVTINIIVYEAKKHRHLY